ncbi:SDR family oxidoreductase [Luteibacter sp. CQ10]|uniref:SDR family oxidoreductase n=1 Tax=Luteibacter sp. CQ10 TaxID=2805821 RepID=UPI0034A27371
MSSPISGKCALITGASSGIGEATARRLAALGMRVGVAARRIDRLTALRDAIVADGGDAFAIEMDVTDHDSVAKGVESFVATYGAVDVLFNNAGIMPVSDIDRLHLEDWHRMVDVNVKGVLNATAMVLPHMIRQHAGHIVNVSSIAGRRVFGPGYTVYSATKFAVCSFSEGLRMEVGKAHNIRVTCIQPGAVATELPDQTADAAKREAMLAYRKQIRFLDAPDIADAVAYAVTAPSHVNVAELFVLPTEQA